MSRIRSVHPGFFKDDRLVATSMAARLLFIGLGVEADDKGIFEWKPLTIKMNVFPGDNVDIAALLGELEAADAIRRYEISGRHYGAIRNFRKFQRPKTPNDVHPITEDVAAYVGAFPQKGENTPAEPAPVPPVGEKSPQMEDGGGSGEGKRKKGSKPSVSETKTALSANWKTPAEWPSMLASRYPGAAPGEILTQLARFKNHYAANGMQMVDWWPKCLNWMDGAFPQKPSAGESGGELVVSTKVRLHSEDALFSEIARMRREAGRPAPPTNRDGFWTFDPAEVEEAQAQLSERAA